MIKRYTTYIVQCDCCGDTLGRYVTFGDDMDLTPVEEDIMQQGWRTAERDGRTLHFCSRHCLEHTMGQRNE